MPCFCLYFLFFIRFFLRRLRSLCLFIIFLLLLRVLIRNNPSLQWPSLLVWSAITFQWLSHTETNQFDATATVILANADDGAEARRGAVFVLEEDSSTKRC